MLRSAANSSMVGGPRTELCGGRLGRGILCPKSGPWRHNWTEKKAVLRVIVEEETHVVKVLSPKSGRRCRVAGRVRTVGLTTGAAEVGSR